MPVPVDAPVSVKDNTEAEVVLLDMETISLAFDGERVVPDLLQKPTVPPPVVISPEQFRAPVELVIVHPVEADPPAILTSTVPSA